MHMKLLPVVKIGGFLLSAFGGRKETSVVLAQNLMHNFFINASTLLQSMSTSNSVVSA